MTDRLDIR